MMQEELDPASKKALYDIEKHGCHIIQVMEEANKPPFSYSIGIRKNLNKPDLCVFGLKDTVAHFVINEYYSRVHKLELIKPNKMYSDFLQGFDVCFEFVDKKYYKNYFGWGLWLYEDQNFDMLQLIYPTTTGLWPWNEGAPNDFKEWQPLLTDAQKT